MITETLIIAYEVKVQSQRARVMLFLKSPHNYHRDDSSGLNLVYEGLLLWMRAGGHRDSCIEAHARRGVLVNLHPITASTTHLYLFL
jgi:hypothetical protein